MSRYYRNLCFIGMPHSGKTFIGNNLALIRNMNFTDTDYLIKEKYHKKLKTLIKEYGNERYLDIERDCILELKTHKNNNIISTGGSAIDDRSGI